MPCSSELLGRGMTCVTASANRARTQGTQTIRITRFDQSGSLTAPRYTILDGGIQAQDHNCSKGKSSCSLDLEKVFGRTLKSSTRASTHSLGKRSTHCSLIKFIDDLKGLQEKFLVAYSLNFKQA